MSGFQKYFWRSIVSDRSTSSDQSPARSATQPATPSASARLRSPFAFACLACCTRRSRVAVPLAVPFVFAMLPLPRPGTRLRARLRSAYPGARVAQLRRAEPVHDLVPLRAATLALGLAGLWAAD